MGLTNEPRGHNQEDESIREKEYLVEAEADLKEHTLERDMSSLFVTFNRNTRPEESTALRLQTISQLYGLRVELPYRTESLNPTITKETKKRIDRSLGVVCISLGNPTKELMEELDYAYQNKRIIVHIHDAKVKLDPLDPEVSRNLIRVPVDLSNDKYTGESLHRIGNFFEQRMNAQNSQKLSAGIALIGIALGMLVLSQFNDDED
ncbi:hypothetical protein [Leptospira weilii]|uniref:hypothetical protein n=1 Tax=Leptospira weilii TaxID=28184 RepID=UPI000773F102